MFKILYITLAVVYAFPEDTEENCTDFEGVSILHGLLYVPGPDMCSLCVCYHGKPMWCKTIFCPGPPIKCKNYIMGLPCCDFKCLDDPSMKTATKRKNRSMAQSPHFQNWTLLYILSIIASTILTRNFLKYIFCL